VTKAADSARGPNHPKQTTVRATRIFNALNQD